MSIWDIVDTHRNIFWLWACAGPPLVWDVTANSWSQPHLTLLHPFSISNYLSLLHSMKPGGCFNKRHHLTCIRNLIVEIRWSYDLFISTMRFPILTGGGDIFILNQGPAYQLICREAALRSRFPVQFIINSITTKCRKLYVKHTFGLNHTYMFTKVKMNCCLLST